MSAKAPYPMLSVTDLSSGSNKRNSNSSNSSLADLVTQLTTQEGVPLAECIKLVESHYNSHIHELEAQVSLCQHSDIKALAMHNLYTHEHSRVKDLKDAVATLSLRYSSKPINVATTQQQRKTNNTNARFNNKSSLWTKVLKDMKVVEGTESGGGGGEARRDTPSTSAGGFSQQTSMTAAVADEASPQRHAPRLSFIDMPQTAERDEKGESVMDANGPLGIVGKTQQQLQDQRPQSQSSQNHDEQVFSPGLRQRSSLTSFVLKRSDSVALFDEGLDIGAATTAQAKSKQDEDFTIRTLQRRLDTAEEEIRSLRSALTHSKDTKKQLLEESKCLNMQLMAICDDNSKLQEHIRQLHEQRDIDTVAWEQEREYYQEKLDDQRYAHKLDVKEAQEAQRALEGRVRTLLDAVDDEQEENAKLKSELAAIVERTGKLGLDGVGGADGLKDVLAPLQQAMQDALLRASVAEEQAESLMHCRSRGRSLQNSPRFVSVDGDDGIPGGSTSDRLSPLFPDAPSSSSQQQQQQQNMRGTLGHRSDTGSSSLNTTLNILEVPEGLHSGSRQHNRGAMPPNALMRFEKEMRRQKRNQKKKALSVMLGLGKGTTGAMGGCVSFGGGGGGAKGNTGGKNNLPPLGRK